MNLYNTEVTVRKKVIFCLKLTILSPCANILVKKQDASSIDGCTAPSSGK